MDNDQIPFLQAIELKCVDIADLMDCYLENEMIAPLRARVDSHLKNCEHCSELFEDCKKIITVARTLDQRPIPKEVSIRLRESLRLRVGHNPPIRTRELKLIK